MEEWYPIAFRRDLEATRPHAFSLHDEPYVLFLDAKGQPAVLRDACPHRSARLSDGRVEEGRLRCLYHGWEFSGDGRCDHIPQWPSERPIPKAAHLEPPETREEEGIVWMRRGVAACGSDSSVPTIAALQGSTAHLHFVDFAIDLPYDQSYLIENVIDVAHIHIAHDGTRGGGRRELAGPLQFHFSSESERGFSATYQSCSEVERQTNRLQGARVHFVGPCLVHYESVFAGSEQVSGLALYGLPLGAGRCRLLYRAYSSLASSRARMRPRWLEHLGQVRILEEDMAVVIGQSIRMSESNDAPQRRWHPLATSDKLVMRYHRWRDEHAADWPRGERARSKSASVPGALELHVNQCPDCARALRRFEMLASRLEPALFVALSLAVLMVPAWPWIVLLAALWSGRALGSHFAARIRGGAAPSR